MDRKNSVMMGLVFDEVSRRWVEKGPDKDHNNKGDGDREDGSDDEDEESDEVYPIPIINNDSKVNVESTEETGLEHSEDGEERGVEQGENSELEKEVTNNMEDDILFSTAPLEDGERDQEGNDIPVTPPVMDSDQSKATVEYRLDHIKDLLVSLDGRLQKMNDVFNKAGGDVSVGMQTMHKDMDCLLKRATDVEKKTKSSRHVTKEFVDRMESIADECERAF
ncbi:hypothetical protein Scep_021786 [Stephania cephalantha]|uniref:Uncharacterized protein n=1 Tax=Stephania cephalantha TaxID=152367 RepID=A0AAP0F9L9_9MAGN